MSEKKSKLFKVTVASGWHDHDKNEVMVVATTEQKAIDAAIKFYGKRNETDNSFHNLEIMATEEEYGRPLPLVIVKG